MASSTVGRAVLMDIYCRSSRWSYLVAIHTEVLIGTDRWEILTRIKNTATKTEKNGSKH